MGTAWVLPEKEERKPWVDTGDGLSFLAARYNNTHYYPTKSVCSVFFSTKSTISSLLQEAYSPKQIRVDPNLVGPFKLLILACQDIDAFNMILLIVAR